MNSVTSTVLIITLAYAFLFLFFMNKKSIKAQWATKTRGITTFYFILKNRKKE